MSFAFYPKHDYDCPHVSHCPHAGGAAIGQLVLLAGQFQDGHRQLHLQIDLQRKQNSQLLAENQHLEAKIEQLQLELRLERQSKFATHKQKTQARQADERTLPAAKKNGTRSAPVGHPGWYRKTPTLSSHSLVFRPRFSTFDFRFSFFDGVPID